MKPSHFDLTQIQHVFERLGEFFPYKMILSLIFVFFSWSFDGKIEIMYTIFTLIVIDTLTGTAIAIKNKWLFNKGLYNGEIGKIFSSRGIYKGPVKVVVYFLMILVSRLVDKHIAPQWASPAMDAFLVSTEGYSILENFAIMGYSVPTTIISKLKFLAGKKE